MHQRRKRDLLSGGKTVYVLYRRLWRLRCSVCRANDGDVVSTSSSQRDVRQSAFVRRDTVFQMQKKDAKAETATATLRCGLQWRQRVSEFLQVTAYCCPKIRMAKVDTSFSSLPFFFAFPFSILPFLLLVPPREFGERCKLPKRAKRGRQASYFSHFSGKYFSTK